MPYTTAPVQMVPVLGGTLQQIGHGLEPAVGVPWRACARSGGELDRSHVVEEEERVDVGQRRSGEGAANDEPIALDGTLGSDQASNGGS